MQIVYISNRKNLSEETLKYVENLMPFIHEAVYICPGVQMNEFKFNSSLKITVINESSVLGKRNQLFRESKDHQFRNWLLRSSLSHLEFIDDEFIMSDDDSRPLKEIPLVFFKRANKYNAYQFFDLKKWPSFHTDYDLGQHNTCRVLEKEGYPTLSYSAHMPQIINKAILEQVLKRFESVFQRQESIDEWSIYFNYAQKEHPDLFNGPLPFKTLCWPVMPSDWAYHTRPDGFFFENFCPYLYKRGRIFGGIPTGFSPEHHHNFTAEKTRRRTALQNAYETGRVSMAGKVFISLRDRVVRFPTIRGLLESLLPPGLQTGMLDFFLRIGFQGDQGKPQRKNRGRNVDIIRTNARIKLLVNAIPMVNVNTGISRYLRSLYAEMERLYGDRLEIGYFDGIKVSSTMPHGPANLNRWVRNVELFWELPLYPALMVRLAFHAIREVLFRQCSRHFELYHEAGFFPFAVPHRLKSVFTICDLSLMLFPQNHPRERVFYSRIFFGRRCDKVDYFLTISNHIAKEMQAILNIVPEKMTVTPLAYDDKVFSPKSPEEIRAFLKRYALPERYFLFVGSGDPRKNLDVIPEALENAGLKIPLVVAGWSGWSDEKSRKNVIPLGYVSDDELARAYSGALGLIFPSSYEGFGLPIVEAMACGCPVVTTREASLPEVAGDAALYLNEARNRAELGHLLNKLASSSAIRTELSRKGRIQAEKFSWEKTAQATFQVFLEVLKK